jgi:hypothetical protein
MIRSSGVCGMFLFLAVAVTGQATPRQAEKGSISSATIRIRVIYAVKNSVGSIDPALIDIKQELEELPFNTFRLLDRLETTIDANATVELQIPGNRSIAVRFLGIDTSEGKRMLSLELAMKPALKIQLRVADGGRTLLGGPSHQEGKLILDVSVKLKDK